MKKLLLSCLLGLVGQHAMAAENCTIAYNTNMRLAGIIKENKFDFANYNSVCQLLQNAHAKVEFTFTSAISEQQTTAVVIARLADQDLPLISETYTASLNWHEKKTSAQENRQLMKAINSALSQINQKDVESLNKVRQKMGVPVYPAT